MKLLRGCALPVALLIGACSAAKSAPEADGEAQKPFASEATQVAVQIDYADGAMPETENELGGGSPFDLAQINLERLFPGRQVTLPRVPEQMRRVDVSQAGPYDSSAILAIAKANRNAATATSSAILYVIWLAGYYADDEGENRNVLGVSLGDTGVIAMFKPVIQGSAGVLPTQSAAYIEQSTLVHEVGHAAGLVNNGLGMAAEHQDREHGAHCNNPECIMYWLNEGSDGLRSFLQRRLTGASTILFDERCLNDVDRSR